MKARLMRCDLQDYHNQLYIAHLLDERSFDLQNEGGDKTFLFRSGALDAPDMIPAGSMRSLPGGYYDRSICERGVSIAEQVAHEAFMNELN
jgi:hypothetical protein